MSAHRVQDWLHLLSCEIESVQRFYSLPPVGRGRFRDWVASGTLKYKEDVVEGLENSPAAFIGLLTGANFGKLVIKVR